MILLIEFSPSSDDPYISCPEIGTPFTLSSFSVSMVPSHRTKKSFNPYNLSGDGLLSTKDNTSAVNRIFNISI